ncbi:gamma-interferon-responsive lysosomal thiol protein-like isoform X2 [Prunus dulcis]|uniref:gamma-interferon-responsive lysosomal thiol protein-like isoform X2 n=1 Tax=Prunus dulcis TaxID=3755 RepID=UPI0014838CE0|nr:gamma-interferon-responsive lysosomal thiol protein-like isoform X2 [Prunus dulcis]
MGFRKLLTFFFFLLLLLIIPSYCNASEKVSVALYYETLCPYCADFIVNHLVKLFQNGLISIINLRLVPWGNAWLNSDGSFSCQHGSDECLLNTIEACTISIYPDVNRHFAFIHCVERLSLQGRHSAWANCFEMSRLGTTPIDCYNSGNGNVDYENFMAYICKAYKGQPPEACRSVRFTIESTGKEKPVPQVCHASEGRNSSHYQKHQHRKV